MGCRGITLFVSWHYQADAPDWMNVGKSIVPERGARNLGRGNAPDQVRRR